MHRFWGESIFAAEGKLQHGMNGAVSIVFGEEEGLRHRAEKKKGLFVRVSAASFFFFFCLKKCTNPKALKGPASRCVDCRECKGRVGEAEQDRRREGGWSRCDARSFTGASLQLS